MKGVCDDLAKTLTDVLSGKTDCLVWGRSTSSAITGVPSLG